MNVWIINQYAVAPTEPGGTRHYSLAKELTERGHSVTIIAGGFNHATRQKTHLQDKELWRQENIGGVSFLWLSVPLYSGNSVRRLRSMLAFSIRVWKRLGLSSLEKPDVIIGSSPHPFAALAAERLAARYGVPFILEVRDLWPQTLIDLGRLTNRHPLVWLLSVIERYLYKRSNKIITLLPKAVDHLMMKGVDAHKVVWLPNGVDLSLCPPPAEVTSKPVLTVMYAGSHGLANALDSILDAARILKQDGWQDRITFRLIGDGPAKPSLEKRAVAEQLGLVTFEKPVAKTEIYRVLQEADCFIMSLKDSPLYRWGISLNKMFDYLAIGRPIVFGANTPANPVLEADAGIVVKPEDSLAMANAIRTIAEMPIAERSDMGLRGRQYAEAHSMTVLGGQLESVLRSAVSKAN